MKISNVDEYANDLLNKGKRFYEKAKQESNDIAISAYFQSSIIFSIMSLETTIFSISDELCTRQDLSLLEKSLLLEKDVSFANGVFSLTDKLKMSKLIDKIDFGSRLEQHTQMCYKSSHDNKKQVLKTFKNFRG